MASKQDYIAHARMIRDMIEETSEPSQAEFDLVIVSTRIDTIFGFALRLSDMFARGSGRFDRGRFASACGFDQTRTRMLASR